MSSNGILRFRPIHRAGTLIAIAAVAAGFAIPDAGAQSQLVPVAWGRNSEFQCDPPSVQMTHVSSGEYHGAAVLVNGTVVCWGGKGTTPSGEQVDYGQSVVPAGLTGVSQVSCGAFHTYALRTNGTFVSWGRNDNGQRTPPAGVTTAKQIECGWASTAVLRTDGSVVQWGDFAPASPVTGAASISVGEWHAYAVRTNGTIVGWGYNSRGQTNTPAGLTGITQVACGGAQTFALRSNGLVVGWGDWDDPFANDPSVVASAQTGVSRIAAGREHVYFLLTDGTLLGFGGFQRPWWDFDQTDTPYGSLGKVTQVSCGSWHNVVLCEVGGTGRFVGVPAGGRAVDVANDGRVAELGATLKTAQGGSSFGVGSLWYRERSAAGSVGAWELVTSGYGSGDTPASVRFDETGAPVIWTLTVDGVGEFKRNSGTWVESRRWPVESMGGGSGPIGSFLSASFQPGPDGSLDVLVSLMSGYVSGMGNQDIPSFAFARLRTGVEPQWELLPGNASDTSTTVLSGFDQPQPVWEGSHGLLPRTAEIARDASGGVHAIWSANQLLQAVSGGTRLRSDLYYAYRSPAGVWSSRQSVVSPGTGFGDGGIGASIAVAPNGTVAIASAYLPRASTGSPGVCELRYLVKQTNGTWSSSVVANAADNYQLGDGPRGTGLDPMLAFDELSRPYIVFADHASYHAPSAWSYAGQVRLATRTSATSGAWTLSKRVSRGSTAPWDFTTWRPMIGVAGGKVAIAATSWLFSTSTLQFTPRTDVVTAVIHATPAPTVAAVTPASGPTAGNTLVTVTGTNFVTGQTTVKVNGIAAASVSVTSATTLTCRTPAGTAGAKPVAVTTPGGTATKTNGFTYVASGGMPAPPGAGGGPASGSAVAQSALTAPPTGSGTSAGSNSAAASESWSPSTGVPMLDTFLILRAVIGPGAASGVDCRLAVPLVDLDLNGDPDLCQLRSGDLDLDGDVDDADGDLVRLLLGRASPDGIADLDGDGWITEEDVDRSREGAGPKRETGLEPATFSLGS